MPNNPVSWNPDEKVIGVLGVAPAATADFYAKLIQLTPAKKDWEHVRVIIDSNPKIPSRGRYFELGETDPVPALRAGIEKLSAMGASVIAVPCNTAHILYKRYSEAFNIAIPNMITATVIATLRYFSTPPQKVAVFASRLTQQYQLYDEAFQKQQGNVLATSAHQEDISALIEAVKQGRSLETLKANMQTLLSAYKNADAIVMGCTELSLLAPALFNGIPIIDSNLALAETCLTLSLNHAFNQQPS